MIGCGMPTFAAPVVDQAGALTQPYRLFLTALYDRTGQAAGVDAAAVQATAAGAVKRSGDTMTGLLILSGPPTASLGAVTKAYADAIAAAAATPSNTNPLVDGTAAPGTSSQYSRGDHVHPTDTSRYAASNPAGYQTAAQVAAALPPAGTAYPIVDGTAATGTSTSYSRQDHVHPTDTSRYAASNPSGYQTAANVTATLASPPAIGGTAAAAGSFTNLTATSSFIFTQTGSSVTTFKLDGSGATNGANLLLVGNGSTTPNKTFRVYNGTLQLLNSAYSASIFSVDDTGTVGVANNVGVTNNVTVGGTLGVTGSVSGGAATFSDLTVTGTSATVMAGAWSTYSGTVTSATGTITTAASAIRYKKLGRTVFITVVVTITTNGTGGQAVVTSLPFTAQSSGPQTLSGRESALTGKGLEAVVGTGSNALSITNYDNSYPGASGAQLVLSGIYEAAA